MKQENDKDIAFSNLMSNMLEGAVHSAGLAEEIINDQHEHLLAQQRRFAAAPLNGFRAGQIVQWKPGMRNRRIPDYGQAAIVMDVLNPPVYDSRKELEGSNLFREPLNLALGVKDDDGDFLIFHFDGRRFEVSTDEGVTP